MNCIAIINQKGGVGKSTTAGAVGEVLTIKGYKVLYIDFDPQGNLTYMMNAEATGATAYEVITKASNINKAIRSTKQGDIIASSPRLAGADGYITGREKEYRLKAAITTLQHDYDYIIIDTPPALGILTVNALAAANRFIVPAQADIFSLQGINQLADVAATVTEYANQELIFDGIVLTRHNRRTVISKNLSESIAEAARAMKTRLYKSTIRECVAIREAQITQRGLFEHAPKSNAAMDYMALTNEILGIENE